MKLFPATILAMAVLGYGTSAIAQQQPAAGQQMPKSNTQVQSGGQGATAPATAQPNDPQAIDNSQGQVTNANPGANPLDAH